MSKRQAGATRIALATVVFILAIGFLLFTENRAHVIAFLPWLIILAWPLMHVFMHGGHGHHHGSARHAGHHGSEPSVPEQDEEADR